MNYIYFENNEWRTFQCDSLPVKPRLCDHNKSESFRAAVLQYFQELSILKSKYTIVQNDAHVMRAIPIYDLTTVICYGAIIEWPGDVKIKSVPGSCPNEICYESECLNGECGRLKVAIMKLPEDPPDLWKMDDDFAEAAKRCIANAKTHTITFGITEAKEVISGLLPIAEDLVCGMSCFPNHKETQDEKRKFDILIDRAKKLLDK